MAAVRTLGVIGTGDMGSAVAGAYVRAGYRVVAALAERSAHSRALAGRVGVEDVGSLRAVAREAELILSIVPPANAYACAESAAVAMVEAGTQPAYVDCNAVAPATVRSIARIFAALGAPFIDAGIVGRGPVPNVEPPTRFFVAGQERARLLALEVTGIRMIDMGAEIGAASALKMAYAALNKGTDALYTAVLLAAERLGVLPALMQELELSQRDALCRMQARVPYLAATAERFAGEMAEIAATYEAAGVTPLFHRGAEWLYTTLAATPLAAETRATLPAERSLDEALAVFTAALEAQPPP